MKNLLGFIKKRNIELYEKISNYNEKDCLYKNMFNLTMLSVEYTYTNAKSGNRKVSKKFFIGQYNDSECTPEGFRKIFDKWLTSENSKRKQ